jgi:hypothetical protein
LTPTATGEYDSEALVWEQEINLDRLFDRMVTSDGFGKIVRKAGKEKISCVARRDLISPRILTSMLIRKIIEMA